MLNAARKLEGYVSRERYNLEKMKSNYKVPYSLYETKARQFNELLDTLNGLYGALMDGADEVFSEHFIQFDDDGAESETTYDDEYSVIATSAPVDAAGPAYVVTQAAAPEPEPEPEPELAQWQQDGFDSYESWLATKEVESAEIADDLDIGLSVEVSMHQADEALSEYDSEKTQDITTYDAEADAPPDVMGESWDKTVPEEQESDEPDAQASTADSVPDDDYGMRSTENLDYMHRTQDNVRVDNDPTQIALVKTAVELEGDAAHKGAEIDIDGILHTVPVEDAYSTEDLFGGALETYTTGPADDSSEDFEDAYDTADESDPDPDDDDHMDVPEDSVLGDEISDPMADISDEAYDHITNQDDDA